MATLQFIKGFKDVVSRMSRGHESFINKNQLKELSDQISDVAANVKLSIEDLRTLSDLSKYLFRHAQKPRDQANNCCLADMVSRIHSLPWGSKISGRLILQVVETAVRAQFPFLNPLVSFGIFEGNVDGAVVSDVSDSSPVRYLPPISDFKP